MPNADHPEPRVRAGFTLLEVMIATAILVIVLGMANQAIIGSAQTSQQLNRASDLDVDAHRILDELVSKLQSGAQVTSPAYIRNAPNTYTGLTYYGVGVEGSSIYRPFIYSTIDNYNSSSMSWAGPQLTWICDFANTTDYVGTPPNQRLVSGTKDNRILRRIMNDGVNTVEEKQETNVADVFGGDATHQNALLAQMGLSWATGAGLTPLPGFFVIRVDESGQPTSLATLPAALHNTIYVGLTLAGTDSQNHTIYRSAFAKVALRAD